MKKKLSLLEIEIVEAILKYEDKKISKKLYEQFKGDSKKAVEHLLNNKFGKGNWGKGAGSDYNALKKWFDRIIRIWSRR